MQKFLSNKNSNKPNLITSLRTTVFFILFYLYIWLVINPYLCYHRQEPIFFFDSSFFKEFLDHPGGLVEYLSAFLSQLNYFPWVGALIITFIAGLFTLTTLRFIKSFSNKHQVDVLHFIPVIFLIILHSQYQQPLSVTIGLLISLLCYNLYIRIAPNIRLLRLGVFLFLTIILHYTIGGPFLLFALLCILFEITKKGHLLMSFVYILFITFLPYLSANYIFMVSVKDAYIYLLPIDKHFNPSISAYALFLFFPIIAIVIALRWRFFPEKIIKEKSKLPDFILHIGDFIKGKARFILQTLIIFVVAGLAAFSSFDKRSRTFLQIDTYAISGKWQEVLKIIKKQKPEGLFASYYNNRALYHTGRLPYDMFSFPQKWGVNGLFFPKEFNDSYPIYRSDLYFDFGHLNEARHWAHEAISVYGNTPRNLQRLALISILKGENQAAQKFLGLLNKNLLFKDWSEHYKHYIENDSLVLMNPELRNIRSLMVDSDFVVLPSFPQMDLKSLLEKNKRNKIAFEYLMAYYLLTAQLNDFFYNLYRLNDFDYPDIPRHYQEALLLYILKTKRDGELNLHGRRLSINIIERFKDYQQIISSHGGNKTAAQNELMEKYGDTYWFYVMYDRPVE